MGNVGDIERITQNRVVKMFKEKLGYTYLGNWEDHSGNSNIEEALLTRYLSKKGCNTTLINKALHELRVTANNYNESLYTNNKNVYRLLRYGVQVKAWQVGLNEMKPNKRILNPYWMVLGFVMLNPTYSADKRVG